MELVVSESPKLCAIADTTTHHTTTPRSEFDKWQIVEHFRQWSSACGIRWARVRVSSGRLYHFTISEFPCRRFWWRYSKHVAHAVCAFIISMRDPCKHMAKYRGVDVTWISGIFSRICLVVHLMLQSDIRHMCIGSVCQTTVSFAISHGWRNHGHIFALPEPVGCQSTLLFASIAVAQTPKSNEFNCIIFAFKINEKQKMTRHRNANNIFATQSRGCVSLLLACCFLSVPCGLPSGIYANFIKSRINKTKIPLVFGLAVRPVRCIFGRFTSALSLRCKMHLIPWQIRV